MDSSDLSLDLTLEIEGLSRATVKTAPPADEAGRLSPVGPLSVIGVDEVAGWREKFEISDDVDIRVSGPIDRVSDFDVDEVHVYEGFFESGFRDRVPCGQGVGSFRDFSWSANPSFLESSNSHAESG